MARPLKVVTYNINRGLGSPARENGLASLVRVLEESEAAVACLQEVWEEEGITENSLEKLTEKVWPHWVFNRNAVFPGGVQGNAVLSRDHVVRSRNVDVSVDGFEPRGFLDVRIRDGAGPGELTVICLHFGLREAERRFQTGRLIRYIEDSVDPEAPLIVAGDFNDWRGVSHRRLVGEGRLVSALRKDPSRKSRKARARTFPAAFPLFSLDRIYFRNLRLLEGRVMNEPSWRGLSDHLPVTASFLPEST